MSTTARTIVVGFDGSEHARQAVRWATAEAARRQVRLEVLTVVDEDSLGIRGPVGMAHWWAEVAMDGARHTGEQGVELAHGVSPGLEVTVSARIGLPAAVLIEASKEAELLVVGTRGRNPLVELALGSVAERVAAHAYCPVVVVHREASVVPGSAHPIVVGVDGSVEARAALDLAADWAAAADAELRVVRAWTTSAVLIDAMSLGQGEDVQAQAMDAARAVVDEAVAHVLEQHPGLKVRGEQTLGVPAQVLCERAVGAGVVVVGSRGLGAFTALVLGSVSHALVRTAPSAVAVVGERVRAGHQASAAPPAAAAVR